MKKGSHLGRKSISILLSFLIGIGPISPTWGSRKGQADLEQALEKDKRTPPKSLKKRPLKSLQKNSKEEKTKIDPPSFTNPTHSGKLEAYSLLDVDYKENKPLYPSLYDQYVLSPVIGDGNCFFHAVFTEEGQTINELMEFSKKLRIGLPELVGSNNQYKKIMRYELLADCRTNYKKYKEVTELKNLFKKLKDNEDFEIMKEQMRIAFADTVSQGQHKKWYKELSKQEQEDIQEEVLEQLPEHLRGASPYNEYELLNTIPDVVIKNYVNRYVDNDGSPDAYIEIPVFSGEQSSIANVISKQENTLIHCFLYDAKSKKLNYKGSLGDPASTKVRSILHNGTNHYWALYNQSEPQERYKSVVQAASNYNDNLKQIFSGISDLKSLTNVSTSASPSISKGAQEQSDPFSWQIGQHYKKLSETFEKLSQQQLSLVVNKIVKVINSHLYYFEKIQGYLLSSLKTAMYNWLLEDILTEEQFAAEQQSESLSMTNSEETDEDPFTKGYNRDSENSNEGSNEGSNHEDYNSEDERENLEKEFKQWQIHKLFEMFGIHVNNIDKFTVKKINTEHVQRFLTKHFEQRNYSWFVNEYVEGVYETSQGFVEKYEKEFGVEKRLLDAIFGGLWFDYDWETFDIREPYFMVQTYIKTLTEFVNGVAGKDIKEHINTTFKDLLFYNSDSFDKPFNELRINYNKFAKAHDWRNALVVWSVYSTYRKVFEQKELSKKIENNSNPLTILYSFNTDVHLLKQVQESLLRAQQHYTKVYPHTDTSQVFYSSRKKPEKTAILNLKDALSELKFIGQKIESHRPVGGGKQRKNILVPRLYFAISDQPHHKDKSNHKRIFIPIELDLNLPKKPLTSNKTDGVFIGKKSETKYYLQQAQQDYVNGQVTRGLSEQEAKKIFKKATKRELVHSERIWLELLRDEKAIDSIVQKLESKVTEMFPQGYEGKFKVYSVLALLYSTNSVCSYCTPSLISAQNSYEKGGFLCTLTQKLNQSNQFKCRGYDEQKKLQNQAKFRLNTIVTATTNFDPQAHDLTESGQHNHTKVGKKKPPAAHNPHGRLVFPNDGIDLHAEPLQENGTLDPQQRYFYEFVGKDLHKNKKLALPFSGIVFSSGGSGWKVPPGVLQGSTSSSSK